MKKILVAVDGSKYSQKALFKAKQIATAMGSEVTILNVVNAYRDSVYVQNRELKEEIGRTTIKNSENILKASKEIFVDFEGKVTTSHISGDAAEEIIKISEAGDFDLVIMGSRGAGLFARSLLGSVSDKVVHHTKTSVMIVK